MEKENLSKCNGKILFIWIRKNSIIKKIFTVQEELELYGMHQAAVRYPQNNVHVRYLMDTNSEKYLNISNTLMYISLNFAKKCIVYDTPW